MVLSATLTQDPSKLAQLNLHHPLLMTTGKRRYQLPEKLESYKLVCFKTLVNIYVVFFVSLLVFQQPLELKHCQVLLFPAWLKYGVLTYLQGKLNLDCFPLAKAHLKFFISLLWNVQTRTKCVTSFSNSCAVLIPALNYEIFWNLVSIAGAFFFSSGFIKFLFILQICDSNLRPLYLVALLQELGEEKCIVFTSSTESTHRLCTLLNLFGDLGIKIKEYSGLQRQSRRR